MQDADETQEEITRKYFQRKAAMGTVKKILSLSILTRDSLEQAYFFAYLDNLKTQKIPADLIDYNLEWHQKLLRFSNGTKTDDSYPVVKELMLQELREHIRATNNDGRFITKYGVPQFPPEPTTDSTPVNVVPNPTPTTTTNVTEFVNTKFADGTSFSDYLYLKNGNPLVTYANSPDRNLPILPKGGKIRKLPNENLVITIDNSNSDSDSVKSHLSQSDSRRARELRRQQFTNAWPRAEVPTTKFREDTWKDPLPYNGRFPRDPTKIPAKDNSKQTAKDNSKQNTKDTSKRPAKTANSKDNSKNNTKASYKEALLSGSESDKNSDHSSMT